MRLLKSLHAVALLLPEKTWRVNRLQHRMWKNRLFIRLKSLAWEEAWVCSISKWGSEHPASLLCLPQAFMMPGNMTFSPIGQCSNPYTNTATLWEMPLEAMLSCNLCSPSQWESCQPSSVAWPPAFYFSLLIGLNRSTWTTWAQP